MALLPGELARRDQGGLQLRPGPLRLRWVFDDLVSGDGHALHATIACSIQALHEPAEQQLLQEVFLGSADSLTVDRAAAYFHSAVRSAVAAACEATEAAKLLAPAGQMALVEAAKSAGQRLAFSSGVDLLPPFEAEVESPTLEQKRMEDMQRSLAEQRAAGQLQHVQRAAELLREFEQLRLSAPQLTAGDMLKQINPADQGMLLQTLLLASAKEKQTQAVWAVAGMSLVRIDPTVEPASVRLIELPSTLGPLRSVQAAQAGPMLLVGARGGVLHLHPDRPQDAVAYVDPVAGASQLGFSRAVLWNSQIWACHGEAGVLAWTVGRPEQPEYTLRPADLVDASPRNLQVLDDAQLIFSSRNRLIVLTRSSPDRPPVATPIATGTDSSEIAALLPDDRRLVVALASGVVQHRDRHSLDVVREERRCGGLTTAALLPWLGSTRLLLATENGAVLGIGLDDDLVTQYLSPYVGLRSLSAAPDLIAGLSADRQRIILWRTWEPRRPAADLYILSHARHRAADVEI